MLPIAILPVAGLLLGIGSSFTNATTIETYGLTKILGEGTILHALLMIMNSVGSAVFNNLPLIFAVGVAIGMAKKAIHGFIDQMPLSTVSFGVIGFAEKNKIFSVISNDERQLRNAVDDIQISPEVGNNNTEQPMDLIYNMLTQYKNQNGLDFGYAVILTDGEWDDNASNAALRAKQKFVSAGFEVIAQGFGEANETFIQKLATRQDLSGVGELSNLSTSMSNIAQVISDGFQA